MTERYADPIGSPQVRPDGWEKVSGSACFVDDLRLPGIWLGGTVRSPVARGRIKGIRLDPAFDWSQVAVVTAEDLPGPNAVAMIRDDHPILAAGEVRFVSEPVALIAAPDRDTLARALEAVSVEIEEETPILTIEDSLAGESIVWGEDNIIAEYRVSDGDPASGFDQADIVVEGTYRTGHQEHLYLEPNGMIAVPREGGGVEVTGSLQCPFFVQAALTKGLGIRPEQAVVRQAATGGAFGGKEDFPSVLALHASLLALRAGRPVKMVYGRTEDILSTTKRHPSRTRHRTGVMRDGTLVAAEIDLVLDGGAYSTLSPVVLSRAVLHAGGPYRIPNVSIYGRVVATNTPPNGAFRGFGAPQAIFAMERQMDKIAARLGIGPLEIRRKNLLRRGDAFPFGQVLRGEVGAAEVLERAVSLSGYEEKRARAGARGDETTRRGIGISLYHHGGGFTGGGEEMISGKVGVRLAEDGRVEILVSNVEMGQGASAVLCAIAARTLGLPMEAIRHPYPDTSVVPDSGPTVASRTTMIVGRLVIDACVDMVGKIKAALARRHGIDPDKIALENGLFTTGRRRLGSFADCASRFVKEEGSLRGEATYSPPPGLSWDEKAHRGDAYKAYSWGAGVVEVEVDMETMEVRPVRATVAVEIGRAINPILAEGQIEGGTLQALGYGYMEEVKLSGGRFLNDRMTTYIIPTSLDAPDFRVEIVEIPYDLGPFGAKGLGELPFDGGAPAIASAIDDATGLFTNEIPITPERLLRLKENLPAAGEEPREEGP